MYTIEPRDDQYTINKKNEAIIELALKYAKPDSLEYRSASIKNTADNKLPSFTEYYNKERESKRRTSEMFSKLPATPSGNKSRGGRKRKRKSIKTRKTRKSRKTRKN